MKLFIAFLQKSFWLQTKFSHSYGQFFSPLDSYFNRERVSLDEIHEKYGHNGQVSFINSFHISLRNMATMDRRADLICYRCVVMSATCTELGAEEEGSGIRIR